MIEPTIDKRIESLKDRIQEVRDSHPSGKVSEAGDVARLMDALAIIDELKVENARLTALVNKLTPRWIKS